MPANAGSFFSVFISIQMNLYQHSVALNRRHDRAMRSRMENPTVDPNTGERLRPMTQLERWQGLPDNSWAIEY